MLINNELHLVAVAQFQKSHGYERIIKGLKEYYFSKENEVVYLHMVGEGEEKRRYVRLVEKYNLQDYVIFHGMLIGENLNCVYDRADIGLGSFGYYKRRQSRATALKTSEYLLKGLPVVTGCFEDIFEGEEVPFYLQFPNNDTPVSINRIVEFYDKLTKQYDERQIKEMTIDFCKRKVDINITFKPVVEYLLSSDEK